MEKGANRPWASRERKRSTRDLHPASTSRRPSFFNRLLRASLAVILAAGLLPLLPVTPAVEEAEALAGTTNYEDAFKIINRRGTPGDISGNILRAASYAKATDSEVVQDSYSSSALLISKTAMPLSMTWRVRASVSFQNFRLLANSSGVGGNMMFGFTEGNNGNSLNGVMLALNANANTSGDYTAYTAQRKMVNSNGTDVSGTRQNIPYSSVYEVTFGYDAGADKLTMTGAGSGREYPGVRAALGNRSSAYMVLMGTLNAHYATLGKKPLVNMETYVEFKGVELPNLNPAIREVKLYNESGKLLGPNDVANPGDKVRVVCRVYNNNSSSKGEAYPTTLKLVSSMMSGFTPFADSSHQVKVMTGTGAVVSTSTLKMDSTTGVSFNLSGTNNVSDRTTDTVVEYWGAISGSAGSAVTVGHQATEDTFGLSSSAVKTILFNERPLKPGDGSGSGTAGHDYHYTRLPAPNANGWNTSPVTVTFYPGDFDQMTLTPSEGAAKVLTGDDPAWRRSDDTAGVSLSAQAKDTATGAVSTQRAGLVKIDTSAPRIEGGGALGYTLTDVPADASKATSGIWRLHRTDSSGAVAAGGRSSAFREFDLTDGDGAPTQAVGNLPNGWYRAEDAAGNLSAPLKVSSTEPPAVERPAGSVAGPSDPGYAPPVGPPLGPGSGPVPDPAVKEDAGGLRHAVIEESVSQMIDPSAPPFGGLLEKSEASALMDYRYASASAAAPTTQTDELLDADGNPIASFDTKVPGECLIRRVITDAQGNTTTILLRYRTVRDSCPPVRPLEPSDPADPDGPRVPGDPLAPTGSVTTNPDGTQHVEVACDVTEAVTHGTMDTAGAEALFKRHFAATDVDGGDGVTLTVQSMKNSSGGGISSIDTSRAADYLITYLVRDAAGNTTTVRLSYHLVSSHVPGVVVTPDPGTDPNPRPGDDPLNPKPRPVDPTTPPRVDPDGTQHAVIEDEMRVKVKDGAQLTLADARSLMERRYAFTPEGGGAVTELKLTLADGAGSPVSAIDLGRPGAWRITYKVADASGNTITVNLRYVVVTDAPTVTPMPDPERPGVGPGGQPLPPGETNVDPETGLTHTVVTDHVVTRTSDLLLTPEAMAEFISARYDLAPGSSGGGTAPLSVVLTAASARARASTAAFSGITASEVRLFNAAGAPALVIDCSEPGVWYAEQVFSDSFGDTTTLKLTYELREGNVQGGISDGGNGGSNGGTGNVSVSEAGPLTGDGSGLGRSRWASAIHQLPQTGGILGPCPLHIMFVLIMVLSGAYTLMRLRQESSGREERRRHDAEWEEFRREAVR